MKYTRIALTVCVGLAIVGSAIAALVIPPDVDMADLDASFRGEKEGEQAGISIAAVGDLNGDGVSDLAIGAAKADTDAGSDAGKVYIIFGREGSSFQGWETGVNLTDADVVFTGEAAKDELGTVVTAAGDINHDGLKDLLVSAPLAGASDRSGAGKVYLVLGRSSGWTSGSIGDAAVASFLGNQGEGAGIALSGGSDIDRDLYDDVIIGSNIYTYKPDPNGSEYYSYAGRAFVIFGRASGWSKDVILDTGADIIIHGYSASQFTGRSVAAGGDLNGDGWDDFVVGAPGAVTADGNSSQYRGEVGIFFGKNRNLWASKLSIADSDVSFVGENPTDEGGGAIALVPDLTDDGFSDLLVGSPSHTANNNSKCGKVYVIKGRLRDQWSAENSLASAEGSWIGEAPNDEAGSSLTTAGDINEDGYRDILVGASKSDQVQLNAGKVYVVYSGPDFPTNALLADAEIQFTGFDYDSRSGHSLAGNMDIDGDGYRDLAMGAPKADYESPSGGDPVADAGAVYVARGAFFQDIDGDGYSAYEGDCIEGDLYAYPGAEEFAYDEVDQDCDGSDLTDVDLDGFDSVEVVGGTDCDDENADAYPGADELCNDQDDDCDGEIDEGVQITFYVDSDGDGYGAPDGDTSVQACVLPEGYSANPSDCDDAAVGTFPGALDIPYDGVDQDCSGADTTDVDGDGQDSTAVEGGTDCADDEPEIYQGAEETPYDGIDDDCDGSDLLDWDGDGYDWVGRAGDDCNDDPGDGGADINPGQVDIPYNGVDENCNGEDLIDVDYDGFPGIGDADIDCDDENSAVYPGAEDIPNDNVDQNCSGALAMDIDNDGYPIDGDLSGEAYDCNDYDSSVHPGATDYPDDGIDQDCDGLDKTDVDGDGFSAGGEEPSDCDDNNPDIYPGAVEIAYDGTDQDCDGSDLDDVDQDGYAGGDGGVDCNDDDPTINPEAQEIVENDIDENCDGYYGDRDGDGFNDYGSDPDCNDNDDTQYPGADEVPYDGIDQDCSGADITDFDGDGFDAAVIGGTDCDDTNADVNPAQTEVLGDGLDNDCDGLIDPEDLDGDGYSVEEGDCNDENATVNPGMPELVGDELDNDCDGRVDERVVVGEQDPGGCSHVGTIPMRNGRGLVTLVGWFGLLALVGMRRRRTP